MKVPVVLMKWAHLLEPQGECLIWAGRLRKDGRPEVSVKVNGKWVRRRPARMVCESVHGELDKLEACHSCNRPACMREDHIYPGTHQQNMNDKQVAGTHNKGERNGMAKLTTAQVLEIRRLRRMKVPGKLVAKKFGIPRALVYRLANKERWGWLSEPS